MNQKLLTYLAMGFGGLVILQSLLGGWLFVYNIGYTPQQISSYYADKSFHALLEVLVPHTLFITVALMGLLHFLAFIDAISQTTKSAFIHLLFPLFILDQSSGLFISIGWEWCVYLKLLTAGMFEIVLAWVWISLYRNVQRELV